MSVCWPRAIPRNMSPEHILAFPEERKSALDRLEDIDKQQEAENKKE